MRLIWTACGASLLSHPLVLYLSSGLHIRRDRHREAICHFSRGLGLKASAQRQPGGRDVKPPPFFRQAGPMGPAHAKEGQDL